MLASTRQFIFKCFSLELSYAYYITKYVNMLLADTSPNTLSLVLGFDEKKKDLLIIPIKELS